MLQKIIADMDELQFLYDEWEMTKNEYVMNAYKR